MFTRRENYISFTLMMLQQLTGVSAVVTYLSMIMAESASSGRGGRVARTVEPETAALSLGIVHFVAFFVSLPLIDRLGRKPLLLISGVGMTISHLVLSGYLYLHQHEMEGKNGGLVEATGAWLPITALCGFIAAFSIGKFNFQSIVVVCILY